MVVPDPLWLSEPVPEITKLSVRLVDCQNCSEPLLVIAPVMVVTGLVMMAVVPLPIVPPLVTALVVCALPVDTKKKKANAEKLHKKRPAITRLSEFVCWGLTTSHAKPLCKANPLRERIRRRILAVDTLMLKS